MEEACEIIERVVNAEMRRRKRFPLEWGGGPLQGGMPLEDKVIWRANVAAANCYEGAKESVGFHSDQLTYLGPYPTIASLSLGKPTSGSANPMFMKYLQERVDYFAFGRSYPSMIERNAVRERTTSRYHTTLYVL